MNQFEKMQQAAVKASDALMAQNIMLVTAESCTGGLIGATCTELAGSSAWFFGGVISYANEAKMQGLGVNENTLIAHGAVSEQTVREMCAGALQLGGGLAVAVSGVAGPAGGSPEKPVGCVYIGWQLKGSQAVVKRCQFVGDRSQVREQTVLTSLQGIVDLLEEK
ncbi:CinA family protein [Marinomonas epiphytica]